MMIAIVAVPTMMPVMTATLRDCRQRTETSNDENRSQNYA
jgi:hypothetical protein